jgi:hypothetical protein
MEYEIKVKLTGKSTIYPEFEKKLKETVGKKVLPDVREFLTNALLVRNMGFVGSQPKLKPLGDFMSQNAGLLVQGILAHVNKNNIDYRAKEGGVLKTVVEFSKDAKVTKVNINLALHPASTETKAGGITITSETIVQKTFNPKFIEEAFHKAAQDLKDK